MSYRLSICIPTCNRDVYLESLLRHLFAQLDGMEHELEVVVSDNASDDRTREVADAYASRPNFRYVRRAENGGAERNFLNAVAHATGEYVWLLGDDEVLLPGAIERLRAILAAEPFDLMIFSTPTKRWVETPTEFASYREFVEHFARVRPETLTESTLISLALFRRAAWEAVPDKERLIPTRYLHTLVIVEALLDRGRIVIRPDALIAVARHRAAMHDAKVHFEINFLHLNLLLVMARMTRSAALQRYVRQMRFRVLKSTAGDLLRLTRRYVRDAWLVAQSARRSATATGRVHGEKK